jgi:type III secretory pathway component EscT
MSPSIVSSVANELAAGGVDLAALGVAWARAMPLVTLVPAFGLRALPVPARMLMALAFAGCIFPAMPAQSTLSLPWAMTLLVEAAHGLPIAVATAVPLWAATMTGGVVDTLRGSQATASAPTVEGEATPIGIPLSLLACGTFLGTGGPAHVVRALAMPPSTHPLMDIAQSVADGVSLSVGLAAPLVAASIIVEITTSLIARSASPAQVHQLLAPLRSIGILATLAIVLERMTTMLTVMVSATP